MKQASDRDACRSRIHSCKRDGRTENGLNPERERDAENATDIVSAPDLEEKETDEDVKKERKRPTRKPSNGPTFIPSILKNEEATANNRMSIFPENVHQTSSMYTEKNTYIIHDQNRHLCAFWHSFLPLTSWIAQTR